MATPYVFNNFPSRQSAVVRNWDFARASELIDWEWSGLNHTPPDAIDDQDGGSITLGSGAASSGDYIQAQHLGSSIQFNRVSKLYEFQFDVQLDSATLTQALIGVCITNTDVLHTNITDGFGFFVNAPSGPAAGNWYMFNAFDSATQYTTYTQIAGPASDTNQHMFSIRLITDSQTLGAGSMTFWMDGVQLGNGISSSSAIFASDEKLRMTVAMANGSGVARTLKVYQLSELGQL